LLGYRAVASGKKNQGKTVRPKVKRKPITPSDEKIKEVLSFIEKHSNCNTGDIIAETGFSSSTVERCLFELRKQGLIKHNGSKKKGGYEMVNIPLDQEEC
ncbi:helix-turn-helix domain-containing protein, partial [Vibrio sp. FNV 38]|nr:helix-turn-helix domain-containing protein [Vibrio sp. FNV 38]MDR9829995.1 helix-turn-helix domain-containing protein [Vibrio sp. FNV 38]